MSLFGNLFDEDGDDIDDENVVQCMSACVSSGVAASSGVKETDENPGLTATATTQPVNPPPSPAPRPQHGLCGIMNQGATCYLNSLLQVAALSSACVYSLYHRFRKDDAIPPTVGSTLQKSAIPPTIGPIFPN